MSLEALFVIFTGSSEVEKNNKEYDEFSLCVLVGLSLAFICSSSTLCNLCAFTVTMYIAVEAHPHSLWGCTLPVRHIPIPSEDVHSWWVTSPFPVSMFIPLWFILLGMRILTENGDMIGRECTSSPKTVMWLAGNAHPNWECWCASPRGLECISSPGMGMWLTRNAHTMYKVGSKMI